MMPAATKNYEETALSDHLQEEIKGMQQRRQNCASDNNVVSEHFHPNLSEKSRILTRQEQWNLTNCTRHTNRRKIDFLNNANINEMRQQF